MGILNFLGGLFKPATEAYKAHKEAKTKLGIAKINAKTARYDAEAARWHKAKDAETDYDMRAQENAKFSWKDEAMLIVYLTPFVLSFVPWTQPYVLKGWDAIKQAPAWYYVILFGITAAVFGLRWWFSEQKQRLNRALDKIEKKD